MYEIDNIHISTILESPEAPTLSANLAKTLNEEKKRRLKFYNDIDDDMKVEFINGEIIVHSPVKKKNTDAVGFLYKILDTFVRISELGYVGYEKVMIALTRNDYEPDVLFFNNDKSIHFDKNNWKYPVPDFVVEILSDSTESRDRGIKYIDYEAHGVQEYWIIDPEAETVEQYLLVNGKFKLHLKLSNGSIESPVVK
jgi:Uma2 family endonuclease